MKWRIPIIAACILNFGISTNVSAADTEEGDTATAARPTDDGVNSETAAVPGKALPAKVNTDFAERLDGG